MKVKFKRTKPNAIVPTYAKPGDAGLDLYAASGGMLNPGDTQVVPTGIAIEIPPGFVGLVVPRSGLAAKYCVSVGNSPGIIDSGYRGELLIILAHHGHRYAQPFQFREGDRLAQLVIVPYAAVLLEEVEALSDSERAEGGLGSTGFAAAPQAVSVQQVVETVEAGASVVGVQIDQIGGKPAKNRKR